MGKRQRRRNRQASTASYQSAPAFTESAVRSDGTIPVLLISPGWGTSGYWGAELLEADGPAAFPAGTHMYWDHPTVSESVERPERSLRDLAAVLDTGARWEANGSDGPGLYAEARVFEQWQPVVDEIAPHIGVSVRARGPHHYGEADGRRGKIIDGIDQGLSVDFVTAAGRGGKIAELVESARHARPALTEGDWSHNEIRDLLRQTLSTFEADDRWIWVCDVGDDWVVWEDYGSDAPDPGYFKATYSVDDDGEATIGTPTKVTARTVYEPATEDPEPAPAPGDPTDPALEEDDMPLNDDDLTKIGDTVGSAVAEALKPLAEAIKPPAGDPTLDEAGDDATELARLREQALTRTARDQAAALFAEGGDLADTLLPKVTVDRLVESCSANPPHDRDDQGRLTLDEAKFAEAVKAAAKTEADYLAEATGKGRVSGLGRPASTGDGPDLDERAARFQSLGMSESAAKAAAAG